MAKLFVVPNEPVTEAEPNQEADAIGESLELSGDVKVDTETALRALAFLIEFIDEAGPDELRRCADEIRSSRVQQ